MKKIILLLSLSLSSLFGIITTNETVIHGIKFLPKSVVFENAMFKLMVECEELTNTYTQYSLSESEDNSHSIFKAVNDDYELTVTFDHKTHNYRMWFNSYSEKIDSVAFDKLIDAVFL